MLLDRIENLSARTDRQLVSEWLERMGLECFLP